MSKAQAAGNDETIEKGTKKPRAAKQGAAGAPGKEKAAPKPKAAKEAPKGRKKGAAEGGTKTEQVLALLKRKGGATVQEIMAATEWQPHTVRGFLAGTVRKKLGLTVTSTKADDGKRTYVIEG
jgi:hypothetical protein